MGECKQQSAPRFADNAMADKDTVSDQTQSQHEVDVLKVLEHSAPDLTAEQRERLAKMIAGMERQNIKDWVPVDGPIPIVEPVTVEAWPDAYDKWFREAMFQYYERRRKHIAGSIEMDPVAKQEYKDGWRRFLEDQAREIKAAGNELPAYLEAMVKEDEREKDIYGNPIGSTPNFWATDRLNQEMKRRHEEASRRTDTCSTADGPVTITWPGKFSWESRAEILVWLHAMSAKIGAASYPQEASK